MIKRLTRNGNSLAMVIDKPILDLLKIDATTPIEITTDGRTLLLTPRPAAPATWTPPSDPTTMRQPA